MSRGTGSPTNEGELVSCLVAFQTGDFDPDRSPCPWLTTPPEPGTAEAKAAQREERESFREAFFDFCGPEQASNLTCRAYESATAP